MKILFACGGTAGHINPALSVAGEIRRRYPQAEILFAGNPDGMEARLVPQAGYPFAPIRVRGFQRSFAPRNIARNLQAVWLLAKSGGTARRILRDFGPDVVMGTGGYVSGPVVRMAHRMGIKTATHEQNAYPGVTTKLLCAYVDKVLLAVEGARRRLPDNREYIVTGNPVRAQILQADRRKAREKLGVGERVCILSFGGSLGAAHINQAVAGLIAWHGGEKGIHHIHATGRGDWEEFPALLGEAQGVLENAHVDVRPYIDDMDDCLAAADLVICRAGATTLSELEAAGKAALLIPSPYVAENHQFYNAMELVDAGAALICEEKNLTAGHLIGQVQQLLQDPGQLARLGQNARKLAILDANARIADEILALIP